MAKAKVGNSRLRVTRHRWLIFAVVFLAIWFSGFTLNAVFTLSVVLICLTITFVCGPLLLISPAWFATFNSVDQIAICVTFLLVYYSLLLFVPKLSGSARGTRTRKRAWKLAFIVYGCVNAVSVVAGLLLYGFCGA